MGPVPNDLAERLDKAGGHINAVERRLWNETERGLWSGHQAVARAAEVWFKLHGLISELPALEKYLPRELMQERLDHFARATAGTPLAARLREIAEAETAILAEPFSNPPTEDRATLEAGLARQHRYLDALRALVRGVEDEIANRHVPLRPGDWARLPDGNTGRLIHRPGLTGWFLVPSIAVAAPEESIKGWALHLARVEPVEPGADTPIGVPAYYWLLAANLRRQEAERMAGTDWITMRDLHAGLNAVLDAAAKAWLITTDPGTNRVMWSQIYAQQHVPRLEGDAPGAVTDPLMEALRRNEAMSLHALKGYGRMPPGWREETAEILRLARAGVTALEEALQAKVDLAAGQWVKVSSHGPGRIALRAESRLVVDLGHHGVITISLFHTPVFPIAEPAGFIKAAEPQHTRWLWFACRPQACRERGVCPCCGLPGIEGEEPGAGPCILCGWTHDGGDYDPQRRSTGNAGLDLALGRRRFEALGYAAVPADEPPGRADVWLDPLVLARKQRLVAGLCDLVREEEFDDDPMREADALWDDFQAALARDEHGRSAQA